jgi:hypothetical protein
MTPRRLPRPRIQRAFVRWLKDNRHRFKVPIQITQITDKGIELHFPQHPDVFSIWLSRWDLSVCVDWQGETWDMLISLDAIPASTPMGYRCTLCENTNINWTSREALWQDHLFAPLLDWVNKTLAPATTLRLYGTRDEGCTWAVLGSRGILDSDEANLVKALLLSSKSRADISYPIVKC